MVVRCHWHSVVLKSHWHCRGPADQCGDSNGWNPHFAAVIKSEVYIFERGLSRMVGLSWKDRTWPWCCDCSSGTNFWYTFSRYHLKLRHCSRSRSAIRSVRSPMSVCCEAEDVVIAFLTQLSMIKDFLLEVEKVTVNWARVAYQRR